MAGSPYPQSGLPIQPVADAKAVVIRPSVVIVDGSRASPIMFSRTEEDVAQLRVAALDPVADLGGIVPQLSARSRHMVGEAESA